MTAASKQALQSQPQNGKYIQTKLQFIFPAWIPGIVAALAESNEQMGRQARGDLMDADLIELGVGMLGRGQPEAVDIHKLEGWQVARLCLAPQAAYRLHHCGGLAGAWHS